MHKYGVLVTYYRGYDYCDKLNFKFVSVLDLNYVSTMYLYYVKLMIIEFPIF